MDDAQHNDNNAQTIDSNAQTIEPVAPPKRKLPDSANSKHILNYSNNNSADLVESDLPPLNVRQMAMLGFIKEGYNNTQAYLKAGYTCVDDPNCGAYQLVSKPPLSLHIRYYLQERARGVTRDWKYDKLRQIVENSVRKTDENGVIVENIALNAIAELNKMQGDYAPVQSVSVNVDRTVEDIRKVMIEYKKEY
jgi:hypothetical protein